MAEGWWELPLACLDTETTGTDVEQARTLEVALVEISPEGKVLGGLHRLCRVDVPIPAEAAAIHGITEERLQIEGADPAEVIAQLLLQLGGYRLTDRPLVILNAPFDWGSSRPRRSDTASSRRRRRRSSSTRSAWTATSTATGLAAGGWSRWPRTTASRSPRRTRPWPMRSPQSGSSGRLPLAPAGEAPTAASGAAG